MRRDLRHRPLNFGTCWCPALLCKAIPAGRKVLLAVELIIDHLKLEAATVNLETNYEQREIPPQNS